MDSPQTTANAAEDAVRKVQQDRINEWRFKLIKPLPTPKQSASDELLQFMADYHGDSWNPKTIWPRPESDLDMPIGEHPREQDCSCEEGQKLECPVHGMHAADPSFDHTYDTKDPNNPADYENHADGPRTWMRAQTSVGDGDGYVQCDQGHMHWGNNGAAGLMLRHVDPSGQSRYLLQHRSPNVMEGNTWSIPGGALDSHESPEEGALREAQEEMGRFPYVNVTHKNTVDHGGWAYHTVHGDVPQTFHAGGERGWEQGDAGWFTPEEIDQLPLHSGFGAYWNSMRHTAALGPYQDPQARPMKVQNLDFDAKRWWDDMYPFSGDEQFHGFKKRIPIIYHQPNHTLYVGPPGGTHTDMMTHAELHGDSGPVAYHGWAGHDAQTAEEHGGPNSERDPTLNGWGWYTTKSPGEQVEHEIEQALQKPKAQDDEYWQFTGHAHGWIKGRNGKGIVTPEGTIYTWTVDEHGAPHHAEYLDKYAPYQVGTGQGYFFKIKPRGGLDVQGYNMPPETTDLVLKSDPRLRAGPATGFHFALKRTSLAHVLAGWKEHMAADSVDTDILDPWAHPTTSHDARFVQPVALRSPLMSFTHDEREPLMDTVSHAETLITKRSESSFDVKSSSITPMEPIDAPSVESRVSQSWTWIIPTAEDHKNVEQDEDSRLPISSTPAYVEKDSHRVIESSAVTAIGWSGSSVKQAADQWDTRQYPDTRMQPATTMDQPAQGAPHPEAKGCTCSQGEKLDCPVHGMNPDADQQKYDHSWSIPQGHPVGYPQNAPDQYKVNTGARRDAHSLGNGAFDDDSTLAPDGSPIGSSRESTDHRYRFGQENTQAQASRPCPQGTKQSHPNGDQHRYLDHHTRDNQDGWHFDSGVGTTPMFGIEDDGTSHASSFDPDASNRMISIPRAEGLAHESVSRSRTRTDRDRFDPSVEAAIRSQSGVQTSSLWVEGVELVGASTRSIADKQDQPKNYIKAEGHETFMAKPKPESEKQGKLWVDDTRKPPSNGWDWARNVHDAINKAKAEDYMHMSLDHDLALTKYKGKVTVNPSALNGADFAVWLHEHGDKKRMPASVNIHTHNDAAVEIMRSILEPHCEVTVERAPDDLEEEWAREYKVHEPSEIKQETVHLPESVAPTRHEADFYHIAPTTERERIQQHGLHPGDPKAGPYWGEEKNHPNWRPPHGVYAWPEGDFADGAIDDYKRFLEEQRDVPHDIWRIPEHEFHAELDPDMEGDEEVDREDAAYYSPHHVQNPELSWRSEGEKVWPHEEGTNTWGPWTPEEQVNPVTGEPWDFAKPIWRRGAQEPEHKEDLQGGKVLMPEEPEDIAKKRKEREDEELIQESEGSASSLNTQGLSRAEGSC